MLYAPFCKFCQSLNLSLLTFSQDFEAARSKAKKCGAKDFVLEVSCRFVSSLLHLQMLIASLSSSSQDMRKEFIEELIFPAVQANAIYEVSW